jgi:plasmid stabilization system protein ParE
LEIRFTPVAIADIQEIKTYIAEDSPASAERIAAAFNSKIDKLAVFPMMGPSLSVKIGIKTDYRYLTCEAYLIIYKVESEYISVYRILNGARDYLSMLFSGESPEN